MIRGVKIYLPGHIRRIRLPNSIYFFSFHLDSHHSKGNKQSSTCHPVRGFRTERLQVNPRMDPVLPTWCQLASSQKEFEIGEWILHGPCSRNPRNLQRLQHWMQANLDEREARPGPLWVYKHE